GSAGQLLLGLVLAVPWLFCWLLRDRSGATAHDWVRLVARPSGVSGAVTDPQHRILWVNETFTALTRSDAEDARGRKPGDLLYFEGTDVASVERARRFFAAKGGVRFEVFVRARSGREFWLESDVQPLLDAHGEVEGYISIQREVTEQVRVRE